MRMGLRQWVTLVCAASASAQSIESARRLYLEARFEPAALAFEAVLTQPDVPPTDLLEAHRHLATLRLLFGQMEEARKHAAAAVALDALVTAPEGAPPEVAVLLDNARQELREKETAVALPPSPSVEPILVPREEPAPAQNAQARVPAQKRRSIWPWVLGGTAVAAVGVAVYFLAIRDTGDDPATFDQLVIQGW